MDLMKKDSRQQSGPFVLTDFAAREHRRTERLVRAAYGVGHTLPCFVAMNRPAQEAKVQQWVNDALDSRAMRLGHIAEHYCMDEILPEIAAS